MSIQNITKKYFKVITFNNVSYNISKGSITGILAPNGAGELTLLNIISGYLNPDKGNIYFNDKLVITFEDRKKIFSYIPEYLDIDSNYYGYDFKVEPIIKEAK